MLSAGYLQYAAADDDFRADFGFIPQVGFHKGYGFYEHYWYSDKNEYWWRRLTVGTETTWLYDRNGNPLQQQAAPYLLVNGPREFFSNLYVGLGPSYFNGRRFNRNFVNESWEMRPSGSIYIKLEDRIGQEMILIIRRRRISCA